MKIQHKLLLGVFVTITSQSAVWATEVGKSPYYERDRFAREYEPVGSAGFMAEDANFKIEYKPVSIRSRLELTLTNKSKKPLVFVWHHGGQSQGDDTAFADGFFPDGVAIDTRQVFNRRVTYDKPLLLAPGKSQKVSAFVSRATRYSEGKAAEQPLCGFEDLDDAGEIASVNDEECVGVPINLEFHYSTFLNAKDNGQDMQLLMNGKKLLAHYRLKSRKAR